MRKKHWVSLALIIAVLNIPLAAQTVSKTEVFDPFISGLQGETIGKTVRLSWVDSRDVQGPVYVYRSIYPFNRSYSFQEITPVEVPYGVQVYEDEIDSMEIRGDTLYYFAAASDENDQKYIFPIMSKNTVALEVPNIPVPAAPPELVIPPEPDTYIDLYAEAVEESSPQITLKNPRAFVRDLEASPDWGEEYDLISVVRGPFAERNWEEAGEELIRFLSLPVTPEIEGRARFYLGQCYYFLHEPWYGLFEFFAIHDMYPAETKEWIKASIAMLND